MILKLFQLKSSKSSNESFSIEEDTWKQEKHFRIQSEGLRDLDALTLFRMSFFGTAHGQGRGKGGKKTSLPKICHAYPKMMELTTVIPYLKKIQKMT